MQQQSYDKTGRPPGSPGAGLPQIDQGVDVAEVALRSIVASNKTFVATLRRPRPGNDAFYGASGQAQAATVPPAAPADPASYELHLEARYQRATLVGNLIFAAAVAVIQLAHRAIANLRRRQQARETFEAMQRLDYRTLRDIGLERNELDILALELKVEAVYEQARSSVPGYCLPR